MTNFLPVFKFNENHDEQGRFASAGGGTDLGSGSQREFSQRANDLYKAHGVADWESKSGQGSAAVAVGPRTYFGTSRSMEMNRFLRGEKTGTPANVLQDWVTNFHNSFAVNGVTIADGTEVYRAVGGSFGDSLDKLKPGDTFIDKGFVSTSGGEPAPAYFGPKVMQITTKGSHRVMLYKYENEVVFEPGRKFKFLGKSQGKGREKKLTFYRMELE